MVLPAVVRWGRGDGIGVQFGQLGAHDTHAIVEFMGQRSWGAFFVEVGRTSGGRDDLFSARGHLGDSRWSRSARAVSVLARDLIETGGTAFAYG
jgi:hypothetical protein